MIVFKRDELTALLKAAKEATATPDKKNIILHSEESGLVLRCEACKEFAAAMLVDYDQVDPLIGWDVAKARITPSVQLVPVGLFSIIAPTLLALGLVKSTDKQYGFYLVFRGQSDGSIGQFSLRPMEYSHLDDEEYKAKCEPAVWPPKDIPPTSFYSGFIPDDAAHMCEVVRNEKHTARGEPLEKFLYAGVKPEVGMTVLLHVILDPKIAKEKNYTRLLGVITEVEPLPPDDAPVDPVIGVSFYKHCKCGKSHPRSELIEQLGTIHGAKVHAIVYVAPDMMNDVLPEWVGEWNVVLVANDALQALWHVYGMGALPRDQWIERIPRVF